MTLSDAAVISASLAEPDRFGVIFDRHVDPIHAYLSRRVGRDAADDLIGEVFRVAFTNRCRYDVDRPVAAPWLYGIASNVVRQHRRTESRQLRLTARLAAVRQVDLADDELVACEEAANATHGRSALVSAIDQLADDDRDTLLLFAWEQLTYEEIGHALAIPTGTVRSRLNRARRKLRASVDRQGDLVEGRWDQ